MRLARAQGGAGSVLTANSPVPVLIVDDHPAKRLALKAVLSPLGYLIVEAGSGTEALRCVMVRDFAVILLDVCMPGMDGFETASLIRQRRQSEMTPIIFITAFASDEIMGTDLYAEGAVDFIFAPVPPAELRAKVSVFANLFSRAAELAEQARGVQESADQLRLLTDAAPIGIFQTDTENRYLYTNPRWTEITGLRPEEAVGRRWDIILDPNDRTGGATTTTTGSDLLYRAELCHRFTVHPKTGPDRVLLVTSRSISDSDGGVAGWVGTLADVTAEAGAEAAMTDARDEANEGSRLKSDFLANMSHEIRTPMNGVIGMTDLLLETDLDAVQRDYAQTVRDSGEALLTIINDILDFSKVEAGKLELECIDFKPRSVVDDVVHLLARPAQDKHLVLTGTAQASVPVFVTGDSGRVRQVLTNLVGNAIKFTQSGNVVVTTDLVEPTDAYTTIRFEVSDTGDGIAPEKLGAIFQPFVQADTSTSRKYGGTGLGLAISGQLVALMGGECGVSSELGRGSTFWFTIKVNIPAGQQSPVQLSSVEDRAGVTVLGAIGDTTQRHVLSGRLLLAEDNLTNQKVAIAMLSSVGYEVDTVPNGEMALQATALCDYDAILMDCQMPVLNGYEAAAGIRAREGALRHTPIIAMTAGARSEDRDRCLAAGMDNYLAKPVRKDALLALVGRYVQRAPAEKSRAGGSSALPSPQVEPLAEMSPSGRGLPAE